MVGSLHEAAEAFAAELNALVAGVFGTQASIPAFLAVAGRGDGDGRRVSVSLTDSREIPVSIEGEHWLNLVAEYHCRWDHAGSFLAVRTASISVAPVTTGVPLFRYEYEADMQNDGLPCAHLHVHAHRDEFLIALLRGTKGKAGSRTKRAFNPRGTNPQLSDVHFPLGGPRMRPALEDVLQMLVTEVGIDVAPDAKEVLEASRVRWRRRQVAAGVRDAPREAAAVLRRLGYTVNPPSAGEPIDRVEKLSIF